MEIVESMTTRNRCFRAGQKITVKGLMLHSVGCPQPSAEVFIKKFDNAEVSKAVHAFIDGNTGKVYQTLPWDIKAWHCGGEGNSAYIGVEMCEPPCIRYTGGAGFTCSDREKAMEVVDRTYRVAVELFAILCKRYGLNPLSDGVILSHKEGHDRKLASGHGDPDHLWKGMGCAYTMDTFRRDVHVAMGASEMPAAASRPAAAPEPLTTKEPAATPKPPTTPEPSTEPESATASEPSTEPEPAAASRPSTAKEPAAASEPAAVKEPAVPGGNIQPGDIVSLAPDAVYDTGKAVPHWVLQDKWIVKSISGDRAVIDKNVDGSHAVCSPVNVKYLRKM